MRQVQLALKYSFWRGGEHEGGNHATAYRDDCRSSVSNVYICANRRSVVIPSSSTKSAQRTRSPHNT